MANDSWIGSVLKRADKTQSADVIQLHKKPSFDALADSIKDAQNGGVSVETCRMMLGKPTIEANGGVTCELRE